MVVFRIGHRALNTHNTYSTVNCKPFLKDGWWKEICYFYLIFSWDYFISLKMTFLFWELHIFLIIFSLSPPAPPRFTSFYYLPNFVGYFFIHWDQFEMSKYSWVCGLSLGRGWFNRAYVLRENFLSLSQQLSFDSSRWHLLSTFSLHADLGWRSHVRLFCHVQKTPFTRSSLSPLLTKLLLVHNDSWTSEEGAAAYMFYLELKIL